MRTIFALLAVLALAGCNTVSDAALKEARVNAAVADGILLKWDAKKDDGSPFLSDLQKKKAVWKLARGQYSVISSVDGTKIPDQYLQGPWATETANTTRVGDGR